MAGKPEVIVLEEHFHLPEVNDLYPPADKNTNPALVAQLNDLGAGRIAEMDKHGIDIAAQRFELLSSGVHRIGAFTGLGEAGYEFVNFHGVSPCISMRLLEHNAVRG